jgi:aspartate/glutamate racemase
MEGPIYPAALARHTIAMRIPAAADRALVDDVIFAELCQGRLNESSRTAFVRIIEDLKRQGCDGVALSCTEIPLLITPEVSPLPTLDSTRLLATEAVATALGDRAPEWWGGPLAPASPVHGIR